MKLKGNYYWMFGTQLLSGIIGYPLMLKLGAVTGILLSFIPFLIGLITTNLKHNPDERDLQLIQKTDSIHGILVMITMTIIYLKFPGLNWFFILVASTSIFRGLTGLIIFKLF